MLPKTLDYPKDTSNYGNNFLELNLSHLTRYSQNTVSDYEQIAVRLPNLLGAVEWASENEQWRMVCDMVRKLVRKNSYLIRAGLWEDAIKILKMGDEAAYSVEDWQDRIAFTSTAVTIGIERGMGTKDWLALESAMRDVIQYQEWLVAHNPDSRDGRNDLATHYQQLGEILEAKGEVLQAEIVYEESLNIKTQLDNRRGMSNLWHQLGNIAFIQNKLALARSRYIFSIQILGDEDAKSITYHQLGMLARQEDNLLEALTYLERALTIKQSSLPSLVNAEHWKEPQPRTFATTYYELAKVFLLLNRIEEAESHCHESIKINEKLNAHQSLASAYLLLGTILLKREQRSEAQYYSLKALHLFELLGDESRVAFTKREIGSIRTKEKDFEGARPYFQQALEWYLEKKDSVEIAENAHLLAWVEHTLHNDGEAERLYDMAAHYYIRRGNWAEAGECFLALSEICYRQKRYDDVFIKLNSALVVAKKADNESLMERVTKAQDLMETMLNDFRERIKAISTLDPMPTDFLGRLKYLFWDMWRDP
jgi:tetratricopeptide (TPR) repeat protein